MINVSNNINAAGIGNIASPGTGKMNGVGGGQSGFSNTINAIEKYLSKVDDTQQAADMTVKDLLTGKTEDFTTVVSAVAKADMSFKLLVGVRNKLIEAYKQTMNMQI